MIDLEAARALSAKLDSGAIHPAECEAFGPLDASFTRRFTPEDCRCGFREVAEAFRAMIADVLELRIHRDEARAEVQRLNRMLDIRFRIDLERQKEREPMPRTNAVGGEICKHSVPVGQCANCHYGR